MKVPPPVKAVAVQPKLSTEPAKTGIEPAR